MNEALNQSSEHTHEQMFTQLPSCWGAAQGTIVRASFGLQSIPHLCRVRSPTGQLWAQAAAPAWPLCQPALWLCWAWSVCVPCTRVAPGLAEAEKAPPGRQWLCWKQFRKQGQEKGQNYLWHTGKKLCPLVIRVTFVNYIMHKKLCESSQEVLFSSLFCVLIPASPKRMSSII